MHESERNARLKRQKALALAASDMNVAMSAAQALLDGIVDDHDTFGDLATALETAVVVSYMRAFTWSRGLKQLEAEQYVLADDAYARLHELFKNLRDTVYAHTDANTEREITLEFKPGGSMLSTELWPPLGKDDLEAAIKMFDDLEGQFRTEIFEIQDEIDGTSWS